MSDALSVQVAYRKLLLAARRTRHLVIIDVGVLRYGALFHLSSHSCTLQDVALYIYIVV